MFATNPQLSKKHSLQRKSTHIHFDASHDMETEEDNRESLVDQILKRQTRMMEEEKHQKIVKKSKMDQAQFNKDKRRLFGQTEQFNRPVHKQQRKSEQDQKLFEQASLEFLRELLLHPNRNQKTLINPEVTNRWILERKTPTKLKSFLTLYMILYQFEHIEFGFKKTVNFDGSEFKTIEIEQIKDKQRIVIEDVGKDKKDDYAAFKKNQMTKYLADYLEWLIWKNQLKFETGPGNVEFWAMALNDCERTAMQLVRSENHRQRQRNVFLSLFLMNAGDVVFRSTLQVPKTQRNIIYMSQEDLSMLPKCHWLLGVNFSLRYFYRNSLENRMKDSLDMSSIDESEINDFYHEYQLLSNYFMKKTVNFSGVSLGDKVLEWIAMNSGCRQVQPNQGLKLSESLVKEICSSLLVKVSDRPHEIRQVEDNMFMVVELLERDLLLQEDQKDRLLSSILYEKEKVAFKLGREFPVVVNKLQHLKQAKLPHLSLRLTEEYTQLYSHLILSQQPNIKSDLLTQLKHLTNINIQKQTEEVTRRINEIVTSFNLLTNWNKEVLKSFVFILEKYLHKLDNFFENQTQKKIVMEIEEKDSTTKQSEEIKTLCSFLKIRLNLESINSQKLEAVIQLIKLAETNKSQLPFEPRTISFFKKDLLSIVFSRNGFNQSLLSEIKKDSVVKGKQGKNILNKLGKITQGNRYFDEQIILLKQEAQNLLMI